MYLGIDLGTSSVKVLLVDEMQNIIGSASQEIAVDRPHRGWSEQSPAEWVASTNRAVLDLKREYGSLFSAIRGIGLSGQMHGATILDKAGKVLRPCILWNDTRSHIEAAEMDADPAFRELYGTMVFPGCTAPKLAWVRKNESDIFKKVGTVLLPKDYLRYWLTGELATEMSDASGTSWLNVSKRAWSTELLDKTEMSIEQMPRLTEGTDASGTLKNELQNAWEMGKVIVAGGAGDQPAAAIGLGAVAEGSTFASLGTSGVLLSTNDAYRPKQETAVHAFCHALPNVWYQMGVILSATDALNWWAGVNQMSAKNLTDELGTERRPQTDLLFLPYLSGERTPHNDAEIRGAFTGLEHNHTRKDMTQAVLEGVAFALRDNQEAILSTGTTISKVMAVGGGSASDYWLSMMSDVLNRPVQLPVGSELGSAFGAARLGIAASETVSHESIMTAPSVAQTFEPDTSRAAGLDAKYQQFRKLYPALKSMRG